MLLWSRCLDQINKEKRVADQERVEIQSQLELRVVESVIEAVAIFIGFWFVGPKIYKLTFSGDNLTWEGSWGSQLFDQWPDFFIFADNIPAFVSDSLEGFEDCTFLAKQQSH